MGESTASLAEHLRGIRDPLCKVRKQQPAKLTGAKGKVSQAFNPPAMLPAIHQRCLDLQFRFFKTVDDLTKNQGYDRDRKEDIGQQVKIGRCFSGKVHHEVEAGEVVALAHGLGPIAQLHVQLAAVLVPSL